MRQKFIIGLSILVLFLSCLPARAAAPLEAVKGYVNQVLDILRDPAAKEQLARELRQDKIPAVYRQMFDEVELSRRVLGRNWNTLNQNQRREFVDLFRKILIKAYSDKIFSYTDQKVVLDREIILAPNQAEVHTRIISSTKEIPVAYRVICKDGLWKVYDVVVENISLVQNYRSQFNEILTNNTPEQMLDILRKKLASQKGSK